MNPRYSKPKTDFRRNNLPAWWNGDLFLAEVIVYICESMLASGHTYPPDLTPRQWHAILEDIRDGYKLYMEKVENHDYSVMPKFVNAQHLLTKYYIYLWD